MLANTVPIANSELRTIEITVQRCINISSDLAFGFIEKKRDYYVEVTVGGKTKKTKNCRRLNQQLDWNEELIFDNVNTSSVTLSLYCYRTLRDPKLVRQLTCPISDSAGNVTPSPIVRTASFSNGPQIEFSLTIIAPLVSTEGMESTAEVDKAQSRVGVEVTEFEAATSNTVPQAVSEQITPEQVTVENTISHDGTKQMKVQVANDGDESHEAMEQAKQALKSQLNPKDGWKRLLQCIHSFRDITGNITEAHPYAKLAHSLFFAIPASLIEQLELDEDVETLFDSFECFCNIVNELKGSDLNESGKLDDILKRISLQMTEVAYFVRDYCKQGNFLKKTLKNKFSGVSNDIQEYHTKIGELKDEFHTRLVLQTGMAVGRTEVKIMRVFTELEAIGQSIDLGGIPYVQYAGLNADKRCLEGTRETFLEEIEEWVNSDGPHTLLISGGAGTGKSSVAQTIAARYQELGRLGSVFCFSEGEKSKRPPASLFPHIARDLASSYVHIRRELIQVASDMVVRTMSGITMQFDKFILQPANAIREHLHGPIVIVIDGLDESGTPGEREVLLKVLADKLKELPPNFRFIITSRPEPDIERAFKRGSGIAIKRMQSIPPDSTNRDILTYIKTQFADSHDIGSDKCQILASHAHGLFQWATVACKYVRAERLGETTLDRYEELLQPLTCVTGDELIGDNLLDYLYHIVLSKVLSPGDKAAMEKFKFVMARILTAFEPLSSKSLNELVTASKMVPKKCKVENVVVYLGSLLSGVDDPDTPIRPLHASFRNFLSDPSRSKDFFIDLGIPDVHSDMALSSMRIMDTELTFNICKLETSYLPNMKVPGIEKLVTKYISRHLSYACRFWAAHLLSLRVFNSIQSSTKPPVTLNRQAEIMKELDHMFSSRLLYFLEVLSLEYAVDPVLEQIRGLCTWFKEDIMDESTTLLLEDTAQFFSYFSKCITTSVPHIYLSALPFTPRGSLVAKNYAHCYNRSLGLESGQLDSYPSSVNMLHGHTGGVRSVRFSPDGTRIVSGSDDKTIRVWDVEYGEMVIGPLKGHTDSVYSVGFSRDGKRILSASGDKTIRVWNAESGETVTGPLQGHTELVFSAEFSQDGMYIVSGSDDTTIRVWNVKSGKTVIGPLRGHTSWIGSVAFSPDGTRIVSSSGDKTIRVWDAQNGEMLLGPLQGHTDWIHSARFSPDGNRIVSGSQDSTIRVWSAENGGLITGPLKGHTDAVHSVAFSSDGTRILSCSYDYTIRVWNAENGEMAIGPFKGHTNTVHSAAFSLDGTRIVSGSHDNTIRIWSTKNHDTIIGPLEGHSGLVYSVGFSPDGKRVVSGSMDQTIRVWSAEDGEAVLEPLRGHTGRVYSAAFSPDGTRIASGSDDKTIRVWNAENGEMVVGPLEGHTSWISSVVFSPDGTRIVSGSGDNSIRMWNAESGEMVTDPWYSPHSVDTVGFSSDGTRIVSGSQDTTIRVWNAENGNTVLGPLHGHTEPITSVAFSPDGTRIVSGSKDHTIRIWNADNGEQLIGPLQGHTDWVFSVGFSPDSTRIVSGSFDNTIRVWNAENGKMVIGPLQGHTSGVLSVAFSPDSTSIVSSSDDKTIRIQGVIEPQDLLNGRFKAVTSTQISHASNESNLNAVLSSSDCDYTQQIVPQGYWHIEDGWSLGVNSELLFYVPPAHRAHLYHPATKAIISTEIPTKLDLTRYVHGAHWTECLRSDATNENDN